MKISEKKLMRIIKEEIQKELEEGSLADRSASGFERIMSVGLVKKVIAKIRNSLEQQGEAGSGSRKEEVMSLLSKFGIGAPDLVKIMGAARGEEKKKAAGGDVGPPVTSDV